MLRATSHPFLQEVYTPVRILPSKAETWYDECCSCSAYRIMFDLAKLNTAENEIFRAHLGNSIVLQTLTINNVIRRRVK
jgi:hypothetical protein